MEEESLKDFINSIIFLVKLFGGLKDKFLAQKLYDKTSGFIAGYIKFSNSKGDNVAQYSAFLELKNATNGLLDIIDYLEYSKLVPTTPLLYARRNLLDLKLNLVRSYQQSIPKVAPKPKESKPSFVVSKNIQPRNLKDNSTKERIFNFIKRSPNSRTKEIIEEFNILSERTVKRNLKELITEGLISKLAKDKGVYYSII